MKSLMFGVCLLLVWCAKGATILNDSFDYTNGPLVIVSAGLWATHSGVTGQVDVVSGRVDLQVPETEYVNAPLAGQPFVLTSFTRSNQSVALAWPIRPRPVVSGGKFFKPHKLDNVCGLTAGDKLQLFSHHESFRTERVFPGETIELTIQKSHHRTRCSSNQPSVGWSLEIGSARLGLVLTTMRIDCKSKWLTAIS
jgi:hypothetical protein